MITGSIERDEGESFLMTLSNVQPLNITKRDTVFTPITKKKHQQSSGVSIERG